jgi:hypothetical protein
MSNALIGILSIAFGVVSVLVGYRMFRAFLALWGFFIGALIGLSILGSSEVVARILALVIGGVVGAILISVLYYIGVVVLGMATGAGLTLAIFSSLGVELNALTVAIVILMAFVAGYIALKLNKLYIILLTSASGATAILYGGLLLFSPEQAAQGRFELTPVQGLIWLVIVIFGVLFQYRPTLQKVEQQMDRDA